MIIRTVCLIVCSISLVGVGFFSPNLALGDYPEKPVTLICGFRPGGDTDSMARGIAEAVKKHFPQPMTVINKVGGIGTIAAAEVINSKPDGYTIGLSSWSVMIMQPLRTELPFGSPEDYTPIMKLSRIEYCLAVNSNAPWKNIQEFIAFAKANPGKLRVGHSGAATGQHLNAELLRRDAEIDLTFVPFAGAAEAVPALLGGHMDAISHTPGVVRPHIEAGKLRALVVFGEQRSPLLPDVPTSKEIGYHAGIETYHFIMGPKGISPKILSTLYNSLQKAIEDPIFLKVAKAGGIEISSEGPENLKKRLTRDYKECATLVDTFNLKEK